MTTWKARCVTSWTDRVSLNFEKVTVLLRKLDSGNTVCGGIDALMIEVRFDCVSVWYLVELEMGTSLIRSAT